MERNREYRSLDEQVEATETKGPSFCVYCHHDVEENLFEQRDMDNNLIAVYHRTCYLEMNERNYLSKNNEVSGAVHSLHRKAKNLRHHKKLIIKAEHQADFDARMKLLLLMRDCNTLYQGICSAFDVNSFNLDGFSLTKKNENLELKLILENKDYSLMYKSGFPGWYIPGAATAIILTINAVFTLPEQFDLFMNVNSLEIGLVAALTAAYAAVVYSCNLYDYGKHGIAWQEVGEHLWRKDTVTGDIRKLRRSGSFENAIEYTSNCRDALQNLTKKLDEASQKAETPEELEKKVNLILNK